MRHTALALICLVLVCAGCSQPRKAADRRAARASAILARAEIRAARLCPACIFRDTVHLMADTAEAPLLFSDSVNVDSLLAVCRQLQEAVSSERDLFAHELMKARQRVAELPPATRLATTHLRNMVTTFEPVVYDSEVVHVTVRSGENAPLLTVVEKGRALLCPPHVGKPVIVEREVKVGVAPWYRVFTWMILASVLLVALYVVLQVRRALLPVLLLLSAGAHAQDWTRTTAARTEGERRLVLQGTLVGADTALLQVYHDGDELHSDVYVRTWSLTLGAEDQYWIKFTDGRGRVKRIALHELSDDMVEFYPPIEVDFDRAGNMVLLKQSTGKPDWQEFDVGLSRQRKRR